MKRWADSGLVTVTRTVGGHRRITITEAVRFIRQIGATLVRPDVLGLTEMAALPADWTNRSEPHETVVTALEHGECAAVRGMVQSMYLGGSSIAAICDGPFRQAMTRIGELWLHQDWGIAVEHRATDISIRALTQLRFLLPPLAEDAPVALGGALETDPYLLPSLMAAGVVAEAGFRDVNLGPRTPIKTVQAAAEHYQAKLVWSAVSAVKDREETLKAWQQASASLAKQGVEWIAGGRAVGEFQASELPHVRIAHSMSDLSAFARKLMSRLRPGGMPEPPHDLSSGGLGEAD